MGKQALDYFNAAARDAVLWTAKQLSEEDRGWLSNLPLVHRAKDFEMVHASFYQPESFEYIFNPEEAAPSFTYQESNLAFFGHTHWPSMFLGEDPVRHVIQKSVPIAPPGKLLVNVGSVGQPRDSDLHDDAHAAKSGGDEFDAVIHNAHWLAVLGDIAYDIAAAAKKILDAGLPASLAERLFHGY